ncbi:MAG: GHKL domain-containing protein [bacterium]|nr:GHKL domain-containing protein [bacterium]
MSIRKRSTLATFASLTIVVILIGVVSFQISSAVVYKTLVNLQISNNRQQAERIAVLIERELQMGLNPENVRANFQRALTLQPHDDSGFVCMLGAETEVLCHPDTQMLGRKMGAAVRRSLTGNEISFGEANLQDKAGGGFFSPSKESHQIVYQVPIKGQNWLMSVHSNQDVITEKSDQIMKTLQKITIPSALLLILMGTMAVRKTSAHYEKHLEAANQQLEQKVEERTAELKRNYEELKKTKEKLAQSEKMSFLGQLMAGITHEINNPLTAVIGNADLLLMKKNLDEKQNKSVRKIKVAGDRCIRLVKNLLTFSRNQPLERFPVPLTAIMDTVIDLLENELKQYKTEINVRIPRDLPPVKVERLQIEQVFINLVKNAMQAMSGNEKPVITISVESQEGFVLVSVKDNGPGIPEESLSHLFDAFFTSKKQGKGTGLGLALCKRFAAAHRGDISVSSRVGEGTDFIVKLPVE